MRPRHEFPLGELTVSYLIAQWHENDGERYDPFPEEIHVYLPGHNDWHDEHMSDALMTVPEIWAVIVEKCREDMLDKIP